MELSLDLSLDSVSNSIPEILLQVSSIPDFSLKRAKLDDYVKRLEDEMRKIDVFKRELPLCVLLLKDAILKLKEEIAQFVQSKDPLKGNPDETEGESEKKKKWLSSAQLWNPKGNMNLNSEEEDRSVPQNPVEQWDCGKRRRGFQLFKDQSEFGRRETKENMGFSEVPKLTLMTPISDPLKVHNKLSQQQQTIRKQRRCWSPELHRRFVDALHRLGGSQVATPKQIRELMQVDGLTNDEVKSHLQKYRLHVRKLGPSEARGSDIWLSEEHCEDHSKTSLSHGGSPDGPLLTNGSAKALSLTEGDSLEAEEDAKSDGHSWKLVATS